MAEPRILSITPQHPNGQRRETQVTNPSHLVAAVDTGLKSGRLTLVHLDLDEALRLQEQMASGIRTVVRVRGLAR